MRPGGSQIASYRQAECEWSKESLPDPGRDQEVRSLKNSWPQAESLSEIAATPPGSRTGEELGESGCCVAQPRAPGCTPSSHEIDHQHSSRFHSPRPPPPPRHRCLKRAIEGCPGLQVSSSVAQGGMRLRSCRTEFLRDLTGQDRSLDSVLLPARSSSSLLP